jgi:rRNA-processing protein FCF1
MKLILTDTNLLIDLIKTNTLEAFFKCPFEIHTNELVLSEIRDSDQKQPLDLLVAAKKLHVSEFGIEEIEQIRRLETKHKLTGIVDKSVIVQAEKMRCCILSGDGDLRKEAILRKIEVHGSIWVLRQIIQYETLNKAGLMP